MPKGEKFEWLSYDDMLKEVEDEKKRKEEQKRKRAEQNKKIRKFVNE